MHFVCSFSLQFAYSLRAQFVCDSIFALRTQKRQSNSEKRRPQRSASSPNGAQISIDRASRSAWAEAEAEQWRRADGRAPQPLSLSLSLSLSVPWGRPAVRWSCRWGQTGQTGQTVTTGGEKQAPRSREQRQPAESHHRVSAALFWPRWALHARHTLSRLLNTPCSSLLSRRLVSRF